MVARDGMACMCGGLPWSRTPFGCALIGSGILSMVLFKLGACGRGRQLLLVAFGCSVGLVSQGVFVSKLKEHFGTFSHATI